MHSLLVLLLVVFAVCSGTRSGGYSRAPTGFVPLPHHKRSTLGDGDLSVVIALKHRNVDLLEQKFWSVSDPNSPDYGNYMNRKQVVDLVAPTADSVNTVINWLVENGVERTKISLQGSDDFLQIYMDSNQIEDIFQAPLTAYVHKKRGVVQMRMDEGYHLPTPVHDLVDFVSDFLAFKQVVRSEVPTPPEASKSKHASRASSNAPVIITRMAGSGAVSFDLFIYCLDGSHPTFTAGGGSGGSDLIRCGSVTLSAVTFTVTQLVTNQQYGEVLGGPVGNCRFCNKDTLCSKSSNDQGALLCDTAAVPVPNYLPYQIEIANSWSNSQTSSSVTSGVLQNSEQTTPSVISRTYNIPSGITVTQVNNQSVLELSENYLKSDAQKYFNYFSLPDYTPLITVVNTQYVSDTDPGQGEGILDIIAIMSTARNCPTYYWGEQNSNTQDSFLKWIKDVLSYSNPPLVHSVSFGGVETPDTNNFHANANQQFMIAGTRGMTIVVASGDNGAEAYLDQSLPPYSPSFPATSPYILSVGATQLVGASKDASCYGSNFATYSCGTTEIVASTAAGSLISSGGGFSKLFDQPSYQKTAVNAYMTAYPPPAAVNKMGRGFPDVSALGHNVFLYHGGSAVIEDGTSAAAPFVAGMVTLWNDIRLKQGRAPLGFINPFLYGLGTQFFNDVTVGDNFCIQTECVTDGFAAVSGWDPVSGLGTPIWDKIASAVGSATSTTITGSTTQARTTESSTTKSATSQGSGTSSLSTSSNRSSSASSLSISLLFPCLVFFVVHMFMQNSL